MRTAYRLLSTAIAVGAIFPIGTLPAHADTSPVAVETAAWFWSEQTYGTGPNNVPLPNIPTDPFSGVKAGQLPVSFKGETDSETGEAKPDKETYLAWDIYFIPEGSYVDSFTFTMFLDPSAEQLFVPQEVAPPGQTPRLGQPSIVACIPQIGFGSGVGDAFEVKPNDDCTDQIFGSYDATAKSYTFDATVYAQDWVDGKDNFGLGIRNPAAATDPFQLIFKGAADVKASISYTPAAPVEPETPVVEPGVVLPPMPPTDTSVFVPAQPLPQPQPQPQAPPVVLAPQPARPVQNVAAMPLTSSRALTPVFWFALLGGALLLGIASLILGDPLEAAPATRRRVRTGGAHRLNVPATVPVRATPAPRPRTV